MWGVRMINCLVMHGNIRNMKDEKCLVGKKLVKNMERKQTSILVILFVVRGLGLGNRRTHKPTE
jgi:preprotein translocase subunit SecG